jgi:signal transduction histidine kinase
MGADKVILAVAGQVSRPEVLYSVGMSEQYQRMLTERYMHLPGARIMATGQPYVVRDVMTEPAYAHLREYYVRESVRGLALFATRHAVGETIIGAVIPDAPAASELIGVLGLYHTEPLDPDPLAIHLTGVLSDVIAARLCNKIIYDEREFFRRQAELENTYEISARLTAGVAHDFNNVLGATLAVVGLASSLGQERQKELYETLEGQVLQGAQLARALLEISRPVSESDERRCELVSSAHKAVTMVATTAHPGCSITVSKERRELWAAVSQMAFSRILLNLLLNAVQAVGASARGHIEVRFRSQETRCEVEVDDNGPGVEKGLEERIFRPFESYGKEGGTGMGLSTARGLAEQVGGSLQLRLREGPGACFVVTLPLAIVPVIAPRASSPSRAMGVGGRVLLAEDEPLQRMMFANALTKAGYTVDQKDQGERARQALLEGEYDAAVLDQRMPGATGFEIVRELRERGSHLPVVMVSGFDVRDRKSQPADLVSTRIVRKPLSGEQLVVELEELLREEAARV